MQDFGVQTKCIMGDVEIANNEFQLKRFCVPVKTS